jgi:hypothetical protein
MKRNGVSAYAAARRPGYRRGRKKTSAIRGPGAEEAQHRRGVAAWLVTWLAEKASLFIMIKNKYRRRNSMAKKAKLKMPICGAHSSAQRETWRQLGLQTLISGGAAYRRRATI